MSKPKLYLAGPINGCTDAQACDWRKEATALAAKYGLDVLDPMARDYRGKEAENVASIVERDKKDITDSFAMLVWYERPSVGTSMEVLFAWENDIPVFIIDRSGKPLSPWLVYHSTGVYQRIEDAIQVAVTVLVGDRR